MTHFRRFGRSLRARFPWHWWLAVIFSALFGVTAGRAFIGTVCVVDGDSMAPTFLSGARIQAGPIDSPLARGDIVLLDDGRKECALKRIVGLPGETVHLWRGQVFINRQMIREPYLSRRTYTTPSEQTGEFVFQLGSGEYFVLGDNRDCSQDSRVYGAVPRGRIKSRVPVPEGTLRAKLTPYKLPAPGQRLILSN